MPESAPASGPSAPAPARASEFVGRVVAELEPLQREFNVAQWDASVTGLEEDSRRRAGLDARIRALLSRPETFIAVRDLHRLGPSGDALLDRQLEVLELLLAAHQMSPETIEKLVELEARLDRSFNNFRASLRGRTMTDNELRRVLRESTDSAERREAWEASKQVAQEVEAPLLELARLRNLAARDRGYPSYYTMMLELDELDERELFDLLERVEDGTREPFRRYRERLDLRLAARCGVSPDTVQPWHFNDPFFQEAPAPELSLDRHFADRDVVNIARQFFATIGLELGDLLERADLYEKPGKSQHAFCLSVDRGDDVRVLCNVLRSELWMSVLLHEFGHAVYDRRLDPDQPWLLRAPAHTLTTEASAMLFGRLSRDGTWLAWYAGVDRAEAVRLGRDLSRSTQEQLLVTTRWCLVMCHMERAIYRDPEQDLSGLWWDLVERFQFVRRPDGRRAPDWASKIHFSVAPVYYHNYLLGEMLASQLRDALLRHVGGDRVDGWRRCLSEPASGRFLIERLYRPGKSRDWRGAIEHATGRPLAAGAFVAEVCAES